MNWKRLTSDPVTTESEVRVFNESGDEGYASVAWHSNCVRLYGPITQIVERFFDADGIEYRDPIRRVVDTTPAFV